jgi:hypothetical protein
MSRRAHRRLTVRCVSRELEPAAASFKPEARRFTPHPASASSARWATLSSFIYVTGGDESTKQPPAVFLVQRTAPRACRPSSAPERGCGGCNRSTNWDDQASDEPSSASVRVRAGCHARWRTAAVARQVSQGLGRPRWGFSDLGAHARAECGGAESCLWAGFALGYVDWSDRFRPGLLCRRAVAFPS